MALNTQVASILEQAANRRYDVKKAHFQANPETADHSDLNIVYQVDFYPEKSEEKPPESKAGKLTLDKAKDLGLTCREYLDNLIGKEPESLVRAAKFRPDAAKRDREAFLSTTIKKLLEA